MKNLIKIIFVLSIIFSFTSCTDKDFTIDKTVVTQDKPTDVFYSNVDSTNIYYLVLDKDQTLYVIDYPSKKIINKTRIINSGDTLGALMLWSIAILLVGIVVGAKAMD